MATKISEYTPRIVSVEIPKSPARICWYSTMGILKESMQKFLNESQEKLLIVPQEECRRIIGETTAEIPE